MTALRLTVIHLAIILIRYYITAASLEGNATFNNITDHQIHLNASNIADREAEDMPNKTILKSIKGAASGTKVPIVTAGMFRKARLELFKKQLLSKLKMNERPDPAVVSRIKLPIPIIKGEVMKMRSGIPARTHRRKKQRIILLPKKVEASCKISNNDPSSCIFFKFKDRMSATSISSAVLWLYKVPDPKDRSGNQTFVLSELKGMPGNMTKGPVKELHESLFVKSGWMQISMKRLLQKWLFHRNTQHGIDISCKTCGMSSNSSPIALDDAHRPFLVVHVDGITENHRTARGKRSINCSANSNACCLHPFEISVSELGWDDWIIHPEKFQANECRGTCDPDVWIPGMSVRASALREFGYSPCCGVSKMASISVLYFNQNGTPIQSNDIKMIAEACDCT